METSLKTKVFYVIASILLSVTGIYWMLSPMNQKANSAIKAHLESPKHGPFDQAMAKSAGMEDLLAKKPKFKGLQKSPFQSNRLDAGLFQNSRPSFSSWND